jgi:curved DNA-binding protein CbpA
VSPAATTAELRRAYRKLALEHHPDRAGPHSAPRFAQIAEAYRMLSDPTARTAYDAHRFERAARRRQTADNLREDGRGWDFGSNNWSASWRRGIVDLLSRLSGPLETLVAAGVAAVDPDGVVELRLSPARRASRCRSPCRARPAAGSRAAVASGAAAANTPARSPPPSRSASSFRPTCATAR